MMLMMMMLFRSLPIPEGPEILAIAKISAILKHGPLIPTFDLAFRSP